MSSTLPSGLQITYFGHSTFVIGLPNGKRILIDPFLQGNPLCPTDKKDVGDIDLMLITHGHSDHFADAVPVAKATGCTVVCIYEIMLYMAKQGIERFQPMNKGGTVHLDDLGLSVTMTHAFHSNSMEEEGGVVYGGEPAGFVVTLDGGFAFYCAGDTAVFSDMALIAELYQPTLAFLPIGDRFTMGPREAAKAVMLLDTVQTVIPMHYATFPMLSGTPDALQAEMTKAGATAKMLVLEPGVTVMT